MELDLRDEQARALPGEALFRAFAEHAPAVMFFKDLDGRYRYVNRRFLDQLGRADEALFAARDAEVLARGAPVEFEETARERVYAVVKFPLFDTRGGAIGIGGVATDITARRQAEQAALEHRTLLEEAQGLAGMGCWEWVPGSGRLVWSEQLYRIYGVDPEGFRPSFENYVSRVHPEDRVRVTETVAAALLDGASFAFEERIVRPDGSVRHLRSRGDVIRDLQGAPLKLLGACLDVTEQKGAEERLRAAADSLQRLSHSLVQAEEAERRRIARELHDRVGQNLSALNINLDIVQGALGESGAREVRMRLRDSLALVDGTLQTIENVMADLRPPLLDEYGLGAALGWHAEDFMRRAELKVELEDRAKERTRELRHETAVLLFRIAQEALNNIAKHARAGKVGILLDIEEPCFVLAIADDGRGFDPDAPTLRLGLKGMRERVEAAGGRLEVASAPGKGTTIRATVPL